MSTEQVMRADSYQDACDEIRRLGQRALRAASAAQGAARSIKRWLPVEKKPWPLQDDRTDGRQVLSHVLGALLDVERSLNPDFLPFDSPNRLEGASLWVGVGLGAPSFDQHQIAAQLLVHCLDRVLLHYGWGQTLLPEVEVVEVGTWPPEAFESGEDLKGIFRSESRRRGAGCEERRWVLRSESWGWTWPQPPAISKTLLACLYAAAERVREQFRRFVEPCCDERCCDDSAPNNRGAILAPQSPTAPNLPKEGEASEEARVLTAIFTHREEPKFTKTELARSLGMRRGRLYELAGKLPSVNIALAAMKDSKRSRPRGFRTAGGGVEAIAPTEED